MAFDQTTRNRLARFVSDTRSLLAEEFTRQLQNDYGLDPNSGDVTDLARLEHLDDARRETARLLRDTMDHYLASADTATPAKAKKARQDVLDRIVREQAFTILNRLCALRMAEARGLLIESIAKGYQSKGFQLYQRLAGTALGETGACYRLFIFSVFDEFAVDLPVLFDRFSPQGRLFPREAALLNVLQEINHPDIDPLWAEDETIGWIYQYFNSVEERRQMRAASQAPRNSRELAVRNQFFTPRYVVEFLTDNTLGRIWYEMTKGESSLKESCRYLVRRPNEIFLAEGEAVPEQDDTGEELSQEELLKQPVHILHRPLKDPRDIKMLDPACGSMHFGLYAFDLFERIYEEAWEIEAQRGADVFSRTEGLEPLHESYTDKNAFLRDMPRLIIERNIHGIDIDPRAVQIAGLSLWLRAQRSWQVQNVKALNRPQIQRSNIVCAEPMPGEADMLEEFTEQLQPKVLGQLVKIIFDKMKLAGEAGSLLKIDEEIKDAVSTAHGAYRKYLLDQKKDSEYLPGMAPKREASLFDFAGLPKEDDFWNSIELRVIDALRNYAEQAESGAFQRRLFAKDAAQGFAFIDLCRKRYDVVLMNPPFGSLPKKKKLEACLPAASAGNLYGAFFIRTANMLSDGGSVGCITDRTFLLLPTYQDYRDALRQIGLRVLADLGWEVLDGAQVATAAYVVHSHSIPDVWFVDSRNSGSKDDVVFQACTTGDGAVIIPNNLFETIPTHPIAHWAPPSLRNAFKIHRSFEPDLGIVRKGLSPGDSDRFVNVWWEIPPKDYGLGHRWAPYANGGPFSPYYRSTKEVVEWRSQGRVIRAYEFADGRPRYVIRSADLYGSAGLTFGKRGELLNVQVLPAGQVLSNEGYLILPHGTKRDFWIFLAFFNSIIARYLVNMVCGLHKEVGAIKVTPISDLLFSTTMEDLVCHSRIVYDACREIDNEETNPEFFLISLNEFSTISELLESYSSRLESLRSIIAEGEEKINAQIADCFQISKLELQELNREQKGLMKSVELNRASETVELEASLLSWLFGAILGRWDIRYSTGEYQAPELSDPFDSLPICPPGILQNAEGLPAEENDVIHCYPMRISWSGILVDDVNHSEDIVARTREAIEVIWKKRSEDIEHEVCTLLGVGTIRDYFQRPDRFFSDHLRRYTKSRRQAPIYWPLATHSGSYTLWLYYHRLSGQTLYTCVNDFVDPKLKQVSDDAASLRGKSNRSSAEEKELERLSDFELELKDFRDELLRIARFWKPNLNDGVQITAAPLWNLFQHRQWKARLKETWEKLEAGDYDWAHLALSIWPDRVVRNSHKDRSYAIAHDLDDQLWHEVEVEKVGRGGRVTTTIEWKPRDLSSADLQRIITEVKAR